MIFRLKKDNIGIIAPGGRRLTAFTPRSLFLILRALEDFKKIEEAAKKYGKETGKRFRSLYKIFSLETLLRFGYKMPELMGWFRIIEIRKENDLIVVKIALYDYNGEEEMVEKIYNFLMLIAKSLLEFTGIAKLEKVFRKNNEGVMYLAPAR